MHTVFIIDLHKNPGLLKFTETKIFFDAKNQVIEWAHDCVVVDDRSQITDTVGVIINSGEFITTKFRSQHQQVNTLMDARGHSDLIQFSPDYCYSYTKRPPYLPGSKQLYILENLYKVVLKSKKLIYLDNTENYTPSNLHPKHFYGLASGWKSIRYVRDFRIDSLENITIFDKCARQLEFQKHLHSLESLPKSITLDPPLCGNYAPTQDVIDFWPQWHRTPVKFELLDLFDTPVFPEQSFIWVSNVFKYEPTIFEIGWQQCKSAKQQLFLLNKSCIINER